MNKILIYTIILIFVTNKVNAQLDANNLMGLPTATNLAQITGITSPQIGALVFNLDDDKIYRYTSTGWEAVDGDNIYNTDGSLTANRTVTMGANSIQFDIDYPTNSDARGALTLRRSNDNNNEIGIAFRNSGNAYDAVIALSGPNGGGADKNAGSLFFYTGNNSGTLTSVTETMGLLDNNQVRFSTYGLGTPNHLNNSPARFLGVETDGDIVEVDASSVGTDDQDASEVDLETDTDVNGGAVETTVQEVVEAIAPITSKAGRVFYPPSIPIDASTVSVADETIDLYQQYANQYDLTITSTTINGSVVNFQTAKSTGAPDDIPIYTANDLYYYVTFADSSVFNIISISATGLLTYRIVGTPSDSNTIINVVFVVK